MANGFFESSPYVDPGFGITPSDYSPFTFDAGTSGLMNYAPSGWMDQTPMDFGATSWLDSLLGNTSAGSLFGDVTGKDVLGFGLGALGKYGDYLAGSKARDLAKQKMEQEAELAREAQRLAAGDDFASRHGLAQILQQRQGINLDPSLAYAEAVRNEMGLTPETSAGFAGVDVGGPMKIGMSTDDRLAALNQALGQSNNFNANFAGGGLSYLDNTSNGFAGLVRGNSGGQEDDYNASLSPGEFVLDSDTVSALGDGNTDAGAAKLEQMRENIRKHKRSAPKNKIPPKAKGPLSYMKGK